MVSSTHDDVMRALPASTRRLLSFNSPVDIAVYDVQGRRVGEIVNGVAVEIEGGNVATFVIDGVKYVFLSDDDGHTIRLTGTGTGTLTYVSETIGETDVVQVFENVPLYAGRQMVSGVAGTADVRLILVEDGAMAREFAADGAIVPIASTIIRLAIGSTTYTIHGIPFQSDAAPFIDVAHERTMVPLRLIAEALGG